MVSAMVMVGMVQVNGDAQKQVWLAKDVSAGLGLRKNRSGEDYAASRAATLASRVSIFSSASCNAFVSGAMNWS